MLDFFDWVVELATNLVSFLMNIIDALITLIVMVPSAISSTTLAVGFLPGIVGSCVLAVLAIGVAKLIAGR